MKKLLLTLLLSVLATTVTAKENVTIVYSWTVGDTAANFHRSLAEEANKIQDKYTFIFDTRPGAGGSLAANHVLREPNTILATASAFFVRPNFFPNESHDIGQFKELLPVCSAPAVITSKKYKSWAEVPANAPLSIGMSGMGTTTHLIATQLAKRYPNMTIIPFKSTSEALVSVLGGNTDFAVNFVGDSAQYTVSDAKNRVYVLGVTGTQTIEGSRPLIEQGFPKDLAVMNVPAQLLVPASVSDAKFKEWRDILVKAGHAKAVKASFAVDRCQPLNQMSDNDIQPWYYKQTADWKRLTTGVSLK
jgi:tripartite-type tricarboxylate transporter receptor subunit TctC